MKPKSQKNIYGVVFCGTKEEIESKIIEINNSQNTFENIYSEAKNM
ncbi:MAG: hypothetical protein H6613_02960 [Ignavibacteriales bacterium]|nr:hypothetical protein [Ignavibacteriales bacterium]